jgi:hypothetical protein
MEQGIRLGFVKTSEFGWGKFEPSKHPPLPTSVCHYISLKKAGGAKNRSFVTCVANNGIGTWISPILQHKQRITECNRFEHRWWVNYMEGEPCSGIFCPSCLPLSLPKPSYHVEILNSIVCASWWVGINDKVLSVTHMTVGISDTAFMWHVWHCLLCGVLRWLLRRSKHW